MKRTAVLTITLLIAVAAVAVAQDAAKEVRGKIYLKGGTTYEGVIQTAEFGVLEGAGIGTERALSNEYLMVDANGAETKVPVGDIATVEADWQLLGPEGAKKWQIASLTITKNDGTKVVGKPKWMLHATEVRVLQADGTIARAHAFPVVNPDFDASQLLVKIELGGAVTAGGGTPAPTTGTTTPAPTTGTTGETTPAPTTGTTTPAPTTGTTGETTPAPTTGAIAPAPTTGGEAAVMRITIACPHCGKMITVEIPVMAKPGG